MPALDVASSAAPEHVSRADPTHTPVPTGPAHGRNPRVRAVLAYAIPFLPAFWLLLRERRNRFVRLHAARSLTFFGCLALAQIALFAALILLGSAVSGLTAATLVGVLFYVLYVLIAVFGFVLWLLLMRDALAGRATDYLFLGGGARWLETRITGVQNRLFPPRAV